MREYLFRAYHKPSGKMYFFDLMWGNYKSGGGYIGMSETNDWNNRTFIDPHECEIMQYSGLCDKSGTRIYEGDYYINKEDTDRNIYSVFFNAGAFCGGKSLLDSIPLGFNEEDHDIFPYHTEWIQVIGNIHEPIPQLTKS